MYVPCGKCMSCKIARTREWTTRLTLESYDHERSCFITLTYRDEDLPVNRSLSKRELQLFMKRLRKVIPEKIKYYACGEYGDLGDREHYHAIIFGWRPPLEDLYKVGSKKHPRFVSRMLESVWPYGFNTVGNVTHDSCQYVAGYVRKKSYHLIDEIYGTRQPPFQLQSQGLGLAYAERHKEEIKESLHVTDKGKNVGLPRYFKKKLGVSTERLYLSHLEQIADKWLATEHLTDVQRVEYFRSAREQEDKNIKAKVSLKKRNEI